MNTERMLSAGIAVVVVVAVGLSASTLASSMSTDPADAVDVDYDTLPLGEDAEGAVSAAAQGIHDQYSQAEDGQVDGAASGDGGESADAGQAGDSDASDDGRAGDSGQAADSGQAGDSDASDDGRSSASSGGSWAVPGGLPWWLLLVAALVVGLVAVSYRYRERFRRAVERDEELPAERLRPAPENEVERAWVELVRRAGVPQPRTRTPRECARLAVETGYDPTAVSRLRRAFEDVRYGAAPPTDEQASVARETLARLDGEGR